MFNDRTNKYVTTGNQASEEFKDLIKLLTKNIEHGDNIISKLKSFFLRITCSQRAKGIAEVSRALLSSPLYHSDFKTVTVSLNYNSYEVASINSIGKTEKISKKTLIHYFAERKDNEFVKPFLPLCYSFLQFAKHFKLTNNKLSKQSNLDKIVVLTTPQIYYYPRNTKKYVDYCYFQYIKYGNWDSTSIKQLNDLNAVSTWENFLKLADINVKKAVR